MKHLFLSLIILIPVLSFGNNPLELDESEIDLSKAEKLESLILNEPNLDYQTLKESAPELMDNFVDHTEDNSAAFLDSSDTIIPPFWWGFCLGIWGILIVLILTDKNKVAVKKAFVGCLVMGISVLAVYGIIILIGLASVSY
ncbi:hypothetical protein [Jiulongibacter sp. NS-SX5]|uniref:hypothetical protein n=1 Tax=Jiulongibacter sp. NS-SX5 TaxID=3463854 RepID=UPI0040588481